MGTGKWEEKVTNPGKWFVPSLLLSDLWVNTDGWKGWTCVNLSPTAHLLAFPSSTHPPLTLWKTGLTLDSKYSAQTWPPSPRHFIPPPRWLKTCLKDVCVIPSLQATHSMARRCWGSPCVHSKGKSPGVYPSCVFYNSEAALQRWGCDISMQVFFFFFLLPTGCQGKSSQRAQISKFLSHLPLPSAHSLAWWDMLFPPFFFNILSLSVRSWFAKRVICR